MSTEVKTSTHEELIRAQYAPPATSVPEKDTPDLSTEELKRAQFSAPSIELPTRSSVKVAPSEKKKGGKNGR